MKKSTDELMKILKSKNNIDEYLNENTDQFLNQTLSQILKQILKKNNVKTSDAIKKSNLNSTYFYEILRGTKTNPSRDILIMICVGMEADYEQTKRVLEKPVQSDRLYIKGLTP